MVEVYDILALGRSIWYLSVGRSIGYGSYTKLDMIPLWSDCVVRMVWLDYQLPYNIKVLDDIQLQTNQSNKPRLMEQIITIDWSNTIFRDILAKLEKM